MNIINFPPRRAPKYISQRKEPWSWNKNQNEAHEEMKAATMVLNKQLIIMHANLILSLIIDWININRATRQKMSIKFTNNIMVSLE